MVNKILTVQTPSGNILLVLPDGNGSVVYLQLNGQPYSGSCENLEYYCCEGKDGLDGKSAYDIAVENGFTGTEQEWLDSLVGNDGVDGVDGLSAYNIWINQGNTGTEQDFLDSLVGPQGDPGTGGADDWGNQVVETDATINGDGTVSSPLSVASPFDPNLLGLDIQGTNLVLQYDGIDRDFVNICLIDCGRIIVEDGDIPDKQAGVQDSIDISTMITSKQDCNPLTYTVLNETNVTVTFVNVNDVQITPTNIGPYSFDIKIDCADGLNTDTATFSGNAI